MKADGLPRRGMRRAFLALSWLSACSAMGCTKCSPTGVFSQDAGSAAPDAGTDAGPSACDVLPNAPDAGPDVAKPCRYWVVDTAIAKTTCRDIPVPAKPGKSWRATSLFGSEMVPEGLLKYCSYEWSDPATNPTDADIALLPATPARSANCTYITPQQTTPDVFTTWARDQLLPPMNQRLPASGNPANVDIKVRVVVLDTAPFTATNSTPSRHGRTLTQLIRESSCQNSSTNPADCAVQVRSALAMPRIMNTQTGIPELRADGGDFGLLSDLASAIWLETLRYRSDLQGQALNPGIRRTIPARVIFNESFGFGNTDAFSKRCGDTPPADDPTTAALFDALMAASCLGVLHVAAAGNHTGGSDHLDGMLCPARWDHALVPTDAICTKLWGKDVWEGSDGLKVQFKGLSAAKTRDEKNFALISPDRAEGTDSLLSVGGVDYHGLPIVLTRPNACPEAVAIGIGGNGLGDGQERLPFLFGTSVSAAVASSRIAVQWAQNPAPTASAMQQSNMNSPTPFRRTAGLCGGTKIDCTREIPWIGRPATPIVGQNSPWPSASANLWIPAPTLTTSATAAPVVCTDKVPHCVRPSKTMTTDAWPQPSAPPCLRCGIRLPEKTEKEPDGRPELWIEPNASFSPGPTDPVLVVEDQGGAVVLTLPVSRTNFIASVAPSSQITLTQVDRSIFTNARVWLSGYDSAGRSYSQQIFVDQ